MSGVKKPFRFRFDPTAKDPKIFRVIQNPGGPEERGIGFVCRHRARCYSTLDDLNTRYRSEYAAALALVSPKNAARCIL